MNRVAENKKRDNISNHLKNESSPYLLQHANNPVDWYPWSDEALTRAKKEDKPIFLSIGYTACHWCHVMEHESFENDEIAKILNDNFISIKVDREERPDLDQIYMAATMALTGGGGWPMTVLLTPELKPFFAGTYFPPEDQYGRPGFKKLITEIARLWRVDRAKIEDFAQSFTEQLKDSYLTANDAVVLNASVVIAAAEGLMRNFDRQNGGFGGSPKFPHPTELSFLMKEYTADKNEEILRAVELSLQKMAQGGIYDQLGGGFHRYSTDASWLVPHFEKMLCDNGLLAVTYSEAYQLTGKEFYRIVVRETLDFILREMISAEGGLYSSLDADSQGEEGKFYVWRKDEIDQLLGDRSDLFCNYYNVTPGGNFEDGRNILNLNIQSELYKSKSELKPEDFEKELSQIKEKLLAERSKRVRPLTDDKTLVSWNGLAISGLARGYQITFDDRYRQAAIKAAEFIKDKMYKKSRLAHSYRDGTASQGPFLEDYAYLIDGLINLYEISFDYEWIKFCAQLADGAMELFADGDANLYLSPSDLTDHYMRPKDIGDGALPSPGSILIQSLLKLADITGADKYRLFAEKSLASLSGNIAAGPQAMISAVVAYNQLTSDKIELVLLGDEVEKRFLPVVYNRYFPNRIVVSSKDGDEKLPLFKGRMVSGRTIAYVCKNSVCQLPVESAEELNNQLRGL